MEKKKYTWIELLRFLIDFIMGRERKSEKERKYRFKDVSKSISKEYKKIDEKKGSNKNKDIEKRLNNLF